jgi:hypothetical protein
VSSVEGATNNGECSMVSTINRTPLVHLSNVANTLWSACQNDTGCTSDAAGEPIKPAGGYAVSVSGAECRTAYRPSFSAVRCWLQDVVAHVSAQSLYGRAAHFGAWFDESARHYYLDVSIIVDTLSEALTLGREHKQLAVWSFADGKAIPVD